MQQYSKSGELLLEFSPGAAFKFKKYYDARVKELHRSFETAIDMDEVSRIKGAIEELRKIQRDFAAAAIRK